MDAFLSLPDSLCCIIMNEWVDLASVGRLDSAYCSRSERRNFLDLLSSKECKPTSQTPSSGRALMWAVMRRLFLSHAQFGECSQQQAAILGQYVKEYGYQLKVVTLGPNTSSCLADAVLYYCSNIVELNLDDDIGRLEIDYCIERHAIRRLGLQADPRLCLVPLKYTPFPYLCALSYNITAWRLAVSLLQVSAIRKLKLLSATVERDGYERDVYITPEHIADIAPHCSHLRSLAFSSLDRTKNFAVSLLSQCPQILNLDLSQSNNLTDEDVRTIVEQLHDLKCLSLRKCCYLTNVTLQHLTDFCKDTLNTLHLGGNKYMTSSAIGALRTICSCLHSYIWYESVPWYHWNDYDHYKYLRLATYITLCKYYDGDRYISSSWMHSAHLVEILDVSDLDTSPCTVDSMLSLVSMSKLHTIIVSSKDYNRWRADLAEHSSRVTVTIVHVPYEFDLFQLPI